MDKIEKVVELYFKGFSVREAIEMAGIDVDIFNVFTKINSSNYKKEFKEAWNE